MHKLRRMVWVVAALLAKMRPWIEFARSKLRRIAWIVVALLAKMRPWIGFARSKLRRMAWVVVALLVTGLVSGFLYWRFWGGRAKAEYSRITEVRKGAIASAVSTTGEVVSVQRVDLKFGTSALLVELNAKPGDEVKEGQVLAMIETTSLEKAVEEKKAELAIAQDNLEKALGPHSELDLIEARLSVMNASFAAEEAREKLVEIGIPDVLAKQLAVNSALLTLEEAKEELAEIETPDVLAKQLAVNDALLTLEEAKEKLREIETPDVLAKQLAVNDALVTLEEAKEELERLTHPDIQSAQIAVRNATTAYENAQHDLVVTQKSKTVSENVRQRGYEHSWYEVRYGEAKAQFERGEINKEEMDHHWSNLMGAKERLDTARAEAAKALANAELRVEQSREALAEAQAELASLRAGPDAIDLDRARLRVAQAEVNLEKAKEELTKTEAGPDPLELAEAQAEVTRTSLMVQEAEMELAKAEAGPDAVDLDGARLQVAQAEVSLEKAKEELAKAEAGPDPLELAKAQAEVTRTSLMVQKAEMELAEIEAGADPEEVKLAKARLTTAQAELGRAQAQLQAATMVAPFDGTVVAVGAEVGETVSANAVAVTLANLHKLMVTGMVNEVDIAKLKIGQQATITFDALPGQRFSGKVLSLPLQGTLVQNILNYEVPITLEYEGDSLRPGMTANVSIAVDVKRDVLLVPLIAIQYDTRGSAFVALQRSAEAPAEDVPVRLGVSDGTNVEVVSGFSEGDRVVITFKSAEEAAAFPAGPWQERQAMPGLVVPGDRGQRLPSGGR